MGVKYFFALLLIILTACSEPALRAVPTSQYQPALEAEQANASPCAEILCPAGQICSDGACECAEGKKCGNNCISEDECCTDSDCGSEICDDGECVKAQECEYGMEFRNGECQCGEGKTYCDEQDKCVDNKSCCRHTECGSFQRCVPTLLRSRICLEAGNKLVCRAMGDNKRPEIFNALNSSFRITAENWWNDQSVTFQINNETIRVPINERLFYEPANATLYQEGIEIVGGFCKEDEDD